MRRFLKLGIFVSFLVSFTLFFGNVSVFSQEDSQTSLRETLRRQIEELEGEIDTTQKKASELSKTIDILNNNIKKQELEIRQLDLAISKTNLDIKDTEELIGLVGVDIEEDRRTLAETIVLLNRLDGNSLLELLLQNRNISDFFSSVSQIESIQNKIILTLQSLKEQKQFLEEKQSELIERNSEQGRFRSLQVTQKRALDSNKKEQQKVLSSTQTQLSSQKKDLASLKSQLFYLEQTGVSIDDAVKFAQLAAGRVGIRTEFLLALLEVETGRAFQEGQLSVGTNLGTGNWRTDMYDCYISLGKRTVAERQKTAFFQITNELNYDPDKMPVSRRPRYGCGGAMGPAQFLPSTWLSYEKRVASVTGHNPPDPWTVEDAFTAAALYLADFGATAKTTAAETAAAKAYISGNPNCTSSICRIYSSNIISLSSVIKRSLGS